MTKKMKVALLFGGKSAEHEVSLQSAKNVYEAIDKDKYEIVLLSIDKTGQWHLNDSSQFLLNTEDPKLIKLNNLGEPVALVPASAGELSGLASEIQDHKIDVVLPILHGTYGEDGTVQGLLKLAGVPFIGAGVLGSALAMDKDVAKRLLRDADIPIAKFITFNSIDEVNFDKVSNELKLPVFVKPANTGSSVGISKAGDAKEFTQAVKNAFKFDSKIIIEENIDGREIEVAVLGNQDPIASVPGEVIPSHEFYSYEAKYLDEQGARLEIPAKITVAEKERIQSLAVKAFKVLECAGMARVDFFLKNNGEILVNEINTIPGFTAISMYPMLWQASGIEYSELIDRLIQLALERFNKEQLLNTDFQVDK